MLTRAFESLGLELESRLRSRSVLRASPNHGGYPATGYLAYPSAHRVRRAAGPLLHGQLQPLDEVGWYESVRRPDYIGSDPRRRPAISERSRGDRSLRRARVPSDVPGNWRRKASDGH